MNIGSLVIEMTANVARIRKDMSEVKGVVNDSMAEIVKYVGVAKEALGALGAITSLAGFGSLIESTITATAELYKLHERTGVTVESMSALRSVAKLSGTEMGDVATALQKLSRSMVESESGTGKAADTFRALGVSVTDSHGKMKTADQVMLEVAQSMGGFKDGAELTTAQMNLFGKSGANMATLLVELAERGNLNGKVSTEQAKAAHEFEQAQIKLQMAVGGVFKSLALDLIPIVMKLTELVKPAVIALGLYVGVFVGLPALVTAGAAALGSFQMTLALASLEMAHGATVGGLLSDALGGIVLPAEASAGALGLLTIAGGVLIAAFAGWQIGEWLRKNFVEADLAGIAFVRGTLLGWENVKLGAGVAWAAIATAWETALSGMGGALSGFLTLVASGLSTMGLSEASSQLLKWAGSVTTATGSTTTLASRTAALTAEYEAARAQIIGITDDMADQAIQAHQTAEAQEKVKKDLGLGNGAAGSATDPAQAIMIGRIKAQEEQINAEKKLLETRNKNLDWYQSLEYINLRASETAKQSITESTAAAVQVAYAKEIEAIKSYIAIGRELAASKDTAQQTKGKGMVAGGSNQLTEALAKQAADAEKFSNDIIASQQKLIAVQRQFDLATAEGTRQAIIANQTTQFQIDMLGKDTLEVMKATEARRIKLALDERIYQLKKLDPTADTTVAEAAAAIQTAQSTALIQGSYNKQRTAIYGASEALRKYVEDANNTGASVERAMTNAFKGMEDALVNFVTTGKLDFSSLVNSMIADLVRFQIQQSIMKPLMQSMSGTGGGIEVSNGGFLDSALKLFGFANGGQPPVGVPSIVGERGPELFIPNTPGTIVPNHALGGSNVTVNVIEDSSKAGTQQQRTTAGGGNVTDVFVAQVKAAIASDISRGSGAIPGAMQQAYGMNRVAGAY
jgi:lambda family phage tail tape measure protein